MCDVFTFLYSQEVFPVHYGQQYEATLHTLVWKFISRLDNLLPVPDIKQVLYIFKHINTLCMLKFWYLSFFYLRIHRLHK